MEAEASFGWHIVISGHSHLGGGTGGGYYKIIAHQIQLIFVPGHPYVNFHVVFHVVFFILKHMVHQHVIIENQH